MQVTAEDEAANPCEHNPTYSTCLTSPNSALPAIKAKHQGAAIMFNKHTALAP
jgi:hypothetical protein